MQTRISSKGQVVLPGPIRRKLGLRPGDALDASVQNGQIVLALVIREPLKPVSNVTQLPVSRFSAPGLGLHS
ncbi:MAG TPA: AbrB/MazE/SpoVT family DNA-binding domain-containing protein [Bryobacteraceae bacterium]|jgi:AbrB family looped-hinge helix DNA binding protein